MRMGKGFTLIELLVALAVSAILLAVAVPSFAEFIRGVRASSDVSSLAAALSLARSEAVKRNRSACIYSDSWGGGWEVRLDDGNDNSCAAASDILVRAFDPVSATAAVSVQQSGADSSEIVFNGSGRRQGAEYTIAYRSVANECNPRRDRNLVIGPTGRTQIEACDP